MRGFVVLLLAGLADRQALRSRRLIFAGVQRGGAGIRQTVDHVDHSGGDEIRITTQHQGERVRVTIRDNGRGIEPALQRDMFQPFIRGATDPAATGLGLGLAIVRELTEMMAGQCGCESAPGAGTSVWLELPAPVTATPAAGPD